MRFSALGDSALVVDWSGSRPAPLKPETVRDFAAALVRANWPGVIDVVPAFATVTVFYDPAKFTAENGSPHDHLSHQLAGFARSVVASPEAAAGRQIVIPVCYGGEFGPDLAAVAQHAQLAPDDVIKLHSSAEYWVRAIGFSPGFPYLDGLPEKLHTPRLATPRSQVPAGSVGIGGVQTGVYPLATPGGWQLIGRTPWKLFDAARALPALLCVGDRVKFSVLPPEKFSTAGEPQPQRHLTDDTVAATSRPASPAKCHPLDDAVAGSRVRVVQAGMLTTLQDLGRHGHRASGVPLSGAMDPVALRIANLLVGNAEGAVALEFTLVGPELEFLSDAIVALGGADFAGLPRWEPVRVTAGTRINFGQARSGCRGYLAIAGGFMADAVLGSGSTFLRAQLGGCGGRTLHLGDVLRVPAIERRARGHWRIDERILPAYAPAPVIRVVRGAQAEEFGAALFAGDFKITPHSDRMGLRLMGPKLERDRTTELVSSAVAPGTIQVPPDGQPIVLMADAQTIGGYPQVAHVITVDLPLVAQLKPDDRLRFHAISLEEAQKLLLAREHALAILHEGLAQKFI